MNNQVIFAAAGNGKTYSLCSKAIEAINKDKRQVLLISYTNEGIKSLENEYKKQNNGVLDNRVVIKTWYSMLLSEFIKPYQCELRLKEKCRNEEYIKVLPENYINSIDFYSKDKPPRGYNQSNIRYFINKNKDIYPERVSHLAFLSNQHSSDKPIKRLEEIYSHIFIDELQDYAGWDLEIIRVLFESPIPIMCVGDYKQTTYRTNNSLKNKQYRDEKIKDYFQDLKEKEKCTIIYENTTRRYNQQICDFVNSIYDDVDSKVVPSLDSDQNEIIENSGVYIIENKYLKKYCEYYHPTILRYDKRAKVNFQHNCNVLNYGSSKGSTFERIVIVPVGTVRPFIEKQEKIEKNITRAKFYVASTRAKHSVVFALDKPKENDRFVACDLYLGQEKIPAYKYVS